MNPTHLLSIGGTVQRERAVPPPYRFPSPKRLERVFLPDLPDPPATELELWPDKLGRPPAAEPSPAGRVALAWVMNGFILSLLLVCTAAAGLNLLNHRKQVYVAGRDWREQEQRLAQSRGFAQWESARAALNQRLPALEDSANPVAKTNPLLAVKAPRQPGQAPAPTTGKALRLAAAPAKRSSTAQLQARNQVASKVTPPNRRIGASARQTTTGPRASAPVVANRRTQAPKSFVTRASYRSADSRPAGTSRRLARTQRI